MPTSNHEKRFTLIMQALLPEWVAEMQPEYKFALPRRYRFDFAWPERRAAVEIDGGRWRPGGGRHGGDLDYEKRNLATTRGWRVIYLTPTMLRDSESVVKAVRELLENERGNDETNRENN